MLHIGEGGRPNRYGVFYFMKKDNFKGVFFEKLKTYHHDVDGVAVIPNYRTDSDGRFDNDKRLIMLSNFIHFLDSELHSSIKLLHDHKGCLTVYLSNVHFAKRYEMKLICTLCWEFFYETEIQFEHLN